MATSDLLMWCVFLTVHYFTITQSKYVTWNSSGPALERFLIDEDYDLIYVAEVNFFHALSLSNMSLNEVGFINNTPSYTVLTSCENNFYKPDYLCQYNNYALHLSTMNVTLNRTAGAAAGTFNTLDTFVTCSSNYSSPACHYRKRSDMTVLREVSGDHFAPYDIYNGTSSLLLSTGALLSGTPFDSLKNSFGISLSTYPFNGVVGVSTISDDDTWVNRVPAPVFVSTYEIDNYAYMFFVEKGLESPKTNPAMYSRVARICKNDTGVVKQLLGGIGSINTFTTFVKARITCSSSQGGLNDIPYYYDNLQSTFLVKSGSFDGSQTSQMHLYGVFTSASFGPVGSAICAFNYATIANAFQTTSFLVRDTTTITLSFNTMTGAQVNCGNSQDTTPKLLSAVVTQSLGPSPIYSATGYTFRRIVVDQVTALDNVTYDVMFVAAFYGDQLLLLKMTYITSRGASPLYTSRSIPVGTSAEWVVQMSLSASLKRPKAVYLATNSKLTVIPVDDCSEYTTCAECVGARDPYCAFDKVTMRCANALSAPRQNLLQNVTTGTTTSCPTLTTTSTAMSATTTTTTTPPSCPSCATCSTSSTVTVASTSTTDTNIVTGNTSGVLTTRVEQPMTNVTWIAVSASLGFVTGIIVGIIMTAAIVNRRKFRWYDLCFPQNDNHGSEKGANGASPANHKDSDSEEKKRPHSNRSKICAVNALSKEEEIEKNNNQVKVLPHHPPQMHPRYEMHLPMNGAHRHSTPLGNARDPNIKVNNTVQEPISNSEKERYRHNFLARGNSLVESSSKVLLPSLPHGNVSVSYTAGVGVHISGTDTTYSDC